MFELCTEGKKVKFPYKYMPTVLREGQKITVLGLEVYSVPRFFYWRFAQVNYAVFTSFITPLRISTNILLTKPSFIESPIGTSSVIRSHTSSSAGKPHNRLLEQSKGSPSMVHILVVWYKYLSDGIPVYYNSSWFSHFVCRTKISPPMITHIFILRFQSA